MPPSDLTAPTPEAAPARAQQPRRVKTRSFATFRTVAALTLREMSSRYGRSPGGYVWAILEPLGGILVMALAFSMIVRSPSLGNSFILFYATGFLPFQMYQNIQTTVSRALSYSKPLMRYPSVTWADALIARLLLNALTGAMVTYILFFAILHLTETRSVLDLGSILEAMFLAIVFGMGVGVINCVLFGLYPAYEMIWSIATRPLFLASGVLMIMEDLPRHIQEWLWYNPLFHITGMMRRGFYPMYNADYISSAYVIGISLVLTALGLVLLQRYHKVILNL